VTFLTASHQVEGSGQSETISPRVGLTCVRRPSGIRMAMPIPTARVAYSSRRLLSSAAATTRRWVRSVREPAMRVGSPRALRTAIPRTRTQIHSPLPQRRRCSFSNRGVSPSR